MWCVVLYLICWFLGSGWWAAFGGRHGVADAKEACAVNNSQLFEIGSNRKRHRLRTEIARMQKKSTPTTTNNPQPIVFLGRKIDDKNVVWKKWFDQRDNPENLYLLATYCFCVNDENESQGLLIDDNCWERISESICQISLKCPKRWVFNKNVA